MVEPYLKTSRFRSDAIGTGFTVQKKQNFDAK
jgi:hypothetical protein